MGAPADHIYNKSLAISWSEIHQDAKHLGQKLKGLRPWKKIIAVTRGGLVPAAIVSRVLGVRLIETVCVMRYDESSEGAVEGNEGLGTHDLEVIKGVSAPDDDENILIVDDLVDFGETAKLVRKWYPNAYFAVLYAKPNGKDQAHAYVRDIGQETWIYFPWELEPKNSKK